MLGNYIHRLAQRSVQIESATSTSVSVIYVTIPPTFTGPIAGYTTLESTTLQTKSTETSKPVKSWTTSTVPNTSAQPVTSVTPTPELPSPTTQHTGEKATIAPPPPPETTAVETSVQPAVERPTPIPNSDPLTTSASNAIVTSLEDLPLSIPSPTTKAPISVPLLVATSSTPVGIMTTPLVTHSYRATPSAAPVPSNTALPNPSSMNASGKVSLILGVTLLLGAACVMYQLYFRKRRQFNKVSRLDDGEKQEFGNLGMSNKYGSETPTQSNTKRSPSLRFPTTSGSEMKILKKESEVNPFGNRAEILVDPVNASGPNLIEKLDPEPPILTRGASIRDQTVSRSITDRSAANYAVGMRNLTANEWCTTHNPPPSAPSCPLPESPMQAAGRIPAVHRVQIDFTPSMKDELELRTGQLIRILHEFDDGWAMCIRLDLSEQGVCPRTCLSTRPLKPRSQSASSQNRPSLSGNQNDSNTPKSKEFEPLPMLPGTHVGLEQRNSPINSPGINSSNSSSLPSQIKGVQNMITSIQENGNQLPVALPLKNAARFVNPMIHITDKSVPHSISELSGSPAPADDYFSFTKPNEQSDPYSNPNQTRTPSPTPYKVGGEIGIPEHFLSQKSSDQKSIPGQAL